MTDEELTAAEEACEEACIERGTRPLWERDLTLWQARIEARIAQIEARLNEAYPPELPKHIRVPEISRYREEQP